MTDRERLIELLNDALAVYDVIVYALLHTDEIADLLISHGVTVQKHGRWILGHVSPGMLTPGGNRPWVCSECGAVISWRLDEPTTNYCSNCGAKMDLEATNG